MTAAPQNPLKKRKSNDLVKIWSFEHDAWWRPNSRGYTMIEAEAGLYERVEAEEIVRQANYGGQLNEEIVEVVTRPSKEQVASLVERAARLNAEADALYKDLNAYFKGKSVRILCPHFNGQPCGRSKPKLQGKVLVVEWVTEHRGQIVLGFAGHDASINLSDVEELP